MNRDGSAKTPFSLEVAIVAAYVIPLALFFARGAIRKREEKLREETRAARVIIDGQRQAIDELHYELDGPAEEVCGRPAAGFRCTRQDGHSGPCAVIDPSA